MMKKIISVMMMFSLIFSICGFSAAVSFAEEEGTAVPTATITNNNNLGWVLTNNVSANSYKLWRDNHRTVELEGFDNAATIQTLRYEPANEPWKTLYKGKVSDIFETVTVNNSCEVYILSPIEASNSCLKWINTEGYTLDGTVPTTDGTVTLNIYKKSFEVGDSGVAEVPLGVMNSNWFNQMFSIVIKWIVPYDGEVSTENEVSYSYDGITKEIVVGANISITADKCVAGCSLSYNLSDENGTEVCSGEAVFDEYGNTKIELSLKYIPGKYIFNAESDMLANTVEAEFEINDYADMIILLNNIKAEEIITGEALVAVIDDETKNLKLDKSFYSLLSHDVHVKAAQEMIYALSDYTVDEFNRVFEEKLIWAAINSKDSSSVKNALEHSDDIIKELISYGDYKNLPSKDEVYSYVAKKEYESKTEFAGAFNEVVAVSSLKEITSKTQITGILEKYTDVFHIDVNNAEYKKYKSYVNGYIADNLESIEVPSDISGIIDEGISRAKKQYASNSDSGGGGGGGGGSSRPSASVSKVEVSKDITSEVPEDIAFEESISFSDVSDEHWAKDSIISLAVKKIVSGNEAGLFKPDAEITRAEFVKIIVNAFGIDASQGEKVFEDVSENDWCFNFVSAGYKNGIIKGSNGKFNPSDSITRQDAFLILYNVLKPEVSEEKEIPDSAEISDYALPAVKALISNGIVSGYEDGSIKPQNKISRAEASKLICNVLEKIKEDK